MPKPNDADPLQVLARQRVSEIVKSLMDKGRSQREVASQLGVSAQYLSDYRNGRRLLTERIARRFEETFGVHWLWLMGRSDQQYLGASPTAETHDVAPSKSTLLPILPHPIEGEPKTHPQWEGSLAEAVGAPAVKAASAKFPYLLKFGADDELRRLRKGDLVLMSQSILPEIAAIESAIQVIRHGRGLYLARRTANGWKRLATSAPELLPLECTVHGYALGIVWGALV